MARRILTWQEKEWLPGRKQLGVHAWGRTFQRLYDFQVNQADAVLPARGDLMTGESGLTAPRVANWRWVRKKEGGVRLAVDWARAVIFTGASGDPLELRGSRVTNEDGKYRYGTRVYAATADTKASDVPALFTNAAGTADTNNGLARRLTGVSKNNTLLPGAWLLTAQYIGFEAHELKFMRTYGADVLKGPRGSQTFVEMAAGAVTKANGLLGTYFPGATPPLPCIAATPHWHPFGIDDIALITARFGLVSSGYRRKHGYVRLTARVMSRAKRKVLKDITGEIIEGWDGTELWMPVPSPKTGRQADHRVDDTVVFLKIETALLDSTGSLADAMALKGKINSDSFTLAQYGRVAKETFLCVGAELVSTYERAITPINWYVEIEPEGWNSILYSQKGRYIGQEISIFREDGVDTLEDKPVVVFQPGKDQDGTDNEPKLRKLHEGVPYSRHMKGLKKWVVA